MDSSSLRWAHDSTRPMVQHVYVEHVVTPDSAPVRLNLHSVENTLAGSLVVKVDWLSQVYAAKARFSNEESRENVKY